MSDFSKILGSLRREAGLSQRVAAEELGVSQALLSHYENGAREPKLEFVTRACSYYGVTADYILGRTGEGVTLGSCPAGAEALINAINEIFTKLRSIGSDELTSSALAYLTVPAENARDLLKNPGTLYDPMRDAELKTIEARFVTNARRALIKDGDDTAATNPEN